MKIVLLLLFFFIPSLLLCQTKISGKVTDKSGNPLPGANVFLKDTYDGVSSGEDGSFSFTTSEKGNAVLVVGFMGYKKYEENLKFEGKDLNIIVVLEEESAELGSVVISAGAFEASDENKGVILRPLDIVSTGSDADIYSTLETLPGTQQVGETEGLFVRGGSAAESKTIIDEMVVQNPFFSSVPDIPSRGRFSPFLFKGTVFSTGGYSAQYGQALSSALILKTDDLAEQTSTSINLMPLAAGVTHVHRWENSSFAIDGTYSNLQPYFKIQKQRTDWETAPHGIDLFINYRIKPTESSIFKLFSTFDTGSLSLNADSPDLYPLKEYFSMKSFNYYFNASYRNIISDQWTLFAGTSFSFDRDKITTADDIDQREILTQAKITVSKNIFGKSFLTFGSEVQAPVYKTAFNQFSVQLDEFLSAGYVEADLFVTDNAALRAGLRGEYSKALKTGNIAPRLSAAYRLNEYNQFNFAYGQFYQSPAQDYLLQTTSLGFEKADHYILNFQHIDDNRTFRIEAYYKKYHDLVKGTVYTYPYMDLDYVPFSNNGKGYAKGIDIFWRDRQTVDLMDYWISYSYLDTKREFGNYPTLAFPTFATPHTFSVVAKYWIADIATYAGVTYSFATGRPYFNPNNTEFLGDRTKNYNNLSLNLSHLTSIYGNFTIIFFSVDNLPGFTNVFGYRYSADKRTRIPVVPTSLRSFFIGMFIQLGVTNPIN